MNAKYAMSLYNVYFPDIMTSAHIWHKTNLKHDIKICQPTYDVSHYMAHEVAQHMHYMSNSILNLVIGKIETNRQYYHFLERNTR